MHALNRGESTTPLEPEPSAELEAANWFFENSLDVFVVVRDQLVERLNPRWTDLTGWRAEEAIGRPMWEFIPPEDAAVVADAMLQLASEKLSTCEHRIRTAEGGFLWFRSRGKEAADGALLVVMQDISEERRTKDEARERQQVGELLRTAAGVYLWLYHPETHEYESDPDLTRSGVNGPIIPADVYQGAIHWEDLAEVDAAWRHTLETGALALVEYRHLHEGEQWLRFRTAWQGLRRLPSGVWEVLGVTQDVTELSEARDAALQSAREAETANRAKSAFLATISHEIRTPMNGVLGMAQAMEVDELSDVQRERLAVVRQCGATLLSILNDVLDLSKIEAGKLELEEAVFQLEELTADIRSVFAEAAHEKGLGFSLAVEAAARGSYRGDAVRLRQILYNLIGNAVKFTDAGRVDVAISAADERLRLTVSDTGVGIDAQTLPRLFEKFVQLDASTTRRYGGTGLGLAICRDLVELMGGTIETQSTLGVGSIFTVELPMQRINETHEATAPSQPAAAGPRPLRVLAAEDNLVNQLVLKTLLRQAGIEPMIVENGALALEAWSTGEWDVVLMDVQMPHMDGPTAARLIRRSERESGRARTPIIALTANVMTHQVAEYQAAGMDGFLPKPIEVAQLFSVLNGVLNCPPVKTALAG